MKDISTARHCDIVASASKVVSVAIDNPTKIEMVIIDSILFIV